MSYDHKSIESKWQKTWEDRKTFATDAWDFSKPKFYALDMFPYPSGVGLHAGHPEAPASFVAALAVITPPRVVITIRAAKKTESSFFAFFIAFHLLQELPSYYTK